MAETPTGFRLRQSVPYRREVGGERFSLGITRVRAHPPMATVGVTRRDGAGDRHDLHVGDVLEIGAERWRVSSIGTGDPGSVDFVPAVEA